jgi:hypothetical protein
MLDRVYRHLPVSATALALVPLLIELLSDVAPSSAFPVVLAWEALALAHIAVQFRWVSRAHRSLGAAGSS